jgi:hypothetical protein
MGIMLAPPLSIRSVVAPYLVHNIKSGEIAFDSDQKHSLKETLHKSPEANQIFLRRQLLAQIYATVLRLRFWL